MNTTDLVYKAIESHDWERMTLYLSRMNILDFRHIQTDIRKKILPSCDNDDFWNIYLHLIRYKKQSFFACVAAIENLAQKNILDFSNNYVNDISLYLHSEHPDSLINLMSIIVPLLTSEEQINGLFSAFDIDNKMRLAVLLKMNYPLTYLVMFKTLCHSHESKEMIRKCCLYIIKKNDDLSLNMACILKEYFDLSDVKCPKSLNIERYELCYIERSSENFINVLLGKRPKL